MDGEPAAGGDEKDTIVEPGAPKDVGKKSRPGSAASKDASSRVRVFIRVRPTVRADEKAAEATGGGKTSAMHCQGEKLWLLETADGSPRPGDARGASPRQFVFDQALPPDSTQEDVYRHSCADTDVIQGVLDGINGCVMCYGQTGAGKTHTLGNTSAGNEGLMHRSISHIFGELAGGGVHREVRLSYVQIYNEQLQDLLRPSNTVELREDPREGVLVFGAETKEVTSVEQAIKIVESANGNRATASTSMNFASSRSHSVLIVEVSSKVGSKLLRGKLHLVDLAGSERVKKSEVTGQAFEEAIAINNSLTCLGRCVQALAAGPKAGKPPFRETKLTRLLSSTFGGRANTVLVVCVAPSTSDSFETLNSLQFGQQAMSVKVQAKVNATVDMNSLEEELFWKLYEVQLPSALAESAAWQRVKPKYESQQAVRSRVDAEMARVESLKAELQAAQEKKQV